MLNPRLGALTVMILAAVATRLLPHPPNMTSIAAVALFGGAYFSDRRLAFVVPLAALLLSDLVLGFYSHMAIQYLAFALIVALGVGLQQRRSATRIAGATFLSAVMFFIVTNLGVWLFEPMYPRTVAGLIACYVAAIPFFGNSLLGDLIYSGILFGGFALLERGFASLREPSLR